MLDNHEINLILEKLENMDDEELAVKLLSEFNKLTAAHGKLILNLDKNLSHEEWKNKCDKSSLEIKNLVNKIKNI